MSPFTDEQLEHARTCQSLHLQDLTGWQLDDALYSVALADLISKSVNSSRFDPKRCAEAMACDHRTLIQSKARLVMEFLRVLACHYDEGRFDLRNEGACRAARVMVNALEGAGIGLPYV
ncbi:MAG: hypothetical protein KF743_12305 [Fimbriimonadaceae bacterium]|nr:hypothetical protein [Fimbriimonadaceae bacterium]